MKKLIILLVVFLMMPIAVNAAILTTSIEVDGIGSLGLGRNTYNLNLHTTLDYATIKVQAIDTATVTITGNDGAPANGEQVPIVEGANTITVNVTDGTNTETWTINLTVDREMEVDSDNPQTGTFLSIVEMVAVLGLGLAMYLYSMKRMLKRL